MACLTQSHRRRKGLETVEAALLFPFLLFLTFGIIEFGWMFVKAHQLAGVVREVARAAAMPDASDTTLKVQQRLAAVGITQYTVVTLNYKVPSGQPVTVAIDAPYADLSLTGAMQFASTMSLPVPQNLHAEVVMAKEGP